MEPPIFLVMNLWLMLLTGEKKVLSLLLKIKDNVDLAGLFPLLELLKDLILSKMENLNLSLNKLW